MRRITSTWAAAGSVLTLAVVTLSARPQYGGTLRLETDGALRAFDPAAQAEPSDRAARSRLLPLVFETLVTVDPNRGLRPALAISWEHDAGKARWRFRLRPDVKLHDGSTLDAPRAAAALASTVSGWTVAVDGGAIVVETGRDVPFLLWELADIRHAIVVRRSGGGLAGTGPFRVDRFEPAQVTLAAHDDYWGGRPFVDAVQIVMARRPAEQLSSLEAGRADMAAVTPAEGRRLADRGFRIAASRPNALVALVFDERAAGAASEPLRRAISLGVDRASVCAVLLQRWAEPAFTVLPAWLSGYAQALRGDVDRARARALARSAAGQARSVLLRVESTDPTDRAIAERIAVDARDIGITLQVEPADQLAPRPDARLVRIPLEPTSPDRALASAFKALGTRVGPLLTESEPPPAGAPLDAVAAFERAVLNKAILVPIVHVPDLYALGPRVEAWNAPVAVAAAGWDLPDLWILSGKR